jgi:DNA-binding IclR family transcriptional regulator
LAAFTINIAESNFRHTQDLVVGAGGKRKEYRLGGRLLRLLHAGSDEAWLAIAVQPILEKLANEMSETCYLARLNGQEVVSVAWAAPNDGLRGYVVSGRTLAPHVAASAKAILAFQSEEIIGKALVGPLPKLTPKTKINRKEVEREYKRVRETGFATCWDEMEIGLGAIAIPIHLPDIGVVYSLASAGLIDRLMQRPISETVAMLSSALDPIIKAMRNRQRSHQPPNYAPILMPAAGSILE